MHSFNHGDSNFHFNSDFSGEVYVCSGKREMRIPGEDLLAFVDEVSRRRSERRDELPDVEGYWWRFPNSGGEPEIVKVSEFGGKLFLIDYAGGFETGGTPIEHYSGDQWSGPLKA